MESKSKSFDYCGKCHMQMPRHRVSVCEKCERIALARYRTIHDCDMDQFIGSNHLEDEMTCNTDLRHWASGRMEDRGRWGGDQS